MKILVVDRAEDSRLVLDILEAVPGNEILTAHTGQEALDLVNGKDLDLLLTEVFIEPMNGFTLRNKMENRHPGVRTVFVSGYDLSPYPEHTAGYEIVPKPNAVEMLLPAIARTMAPVAPPPAPIPEPEPEPVPATAPPPVAVPKAIAPEAAPLRVPKAATVVVSVPRNVSARTTTSFGTRKPGSLSAPRVAAAKPPAEGTSVPPVAPDSSGDPFLGKTIGSYRVERRLGTGRWGPMYLAIQTSMNRPVAMEMLAPEAAEDEAGRLRFVASARAKAAVQHPHILSVYEADESEEYIFYTHEYVDGLTLAQIASKGEGLSEHLALQTIKAVSQALAHLHHHNVSHSVPTASDIYIGPEGLPYLANLALPAEQMPGVAEEIRALGEVILTVLPGGRAQERGLQAMLLRMCSANQMGFQSWPALFQAIEAIEPKVIPLDAFKLSAQDQVAVRVVEQVRKRQRRNLLLSTAGLFALVCLVGFAVWWQFLRPLSHDYSNIMVRIPAGSFIYQNGQTETLPEFYIDKYEVTIAEYDVFLKFLASHNNPTDYDSPLQPAGRSHVPRDWDVYYGRASSGFSGYRTVHGVPITLDCPVFNVDYFDAYAYANWKGRRLPTEKEWERAARGASGNLYPWGNNWDPSKLNAGGDYRAEPPADYKPLVDGFTCWAPVDALPGDSSPDGVIGMAGNVSEWTDSWDATKTFVVIRGGNYKSGPGQALATASIKAYPQTTAETLGFRTASDKPPAK